MWVLAQVKGGAHGAPLWPLMLFSEVGPGRVNIQPIYREIFKFLPYMEF